MPNWLLPTFLHTVEATIVVLLAVAIAYFFPEHRVEAGGLAFVSLTFAAKGLRSSDVAVPDYVNKAGE